MSLARRHRDRLLAAAAVATLAGRSEAAPPVKDRRPAKAKSKVKPSEATGVTAPDGQILPLPLSHRRGLAWRKVQKLNAAAQTLQAANDNAPLEAPEPASPYDLERLRLVDAQRRLKRIQSIEKKIELKRELLPDFMPWVDGALQAAEKAGRAAPDDIVGTMLVWAIDVGDYEVAIRIGQHVLAHDLPLPQRFDRKPAVLITEQIAENALAATAAGRDFPPEVLAYVEILTGKHDMPDQVRAKLYKALGQDYLRAAGEKPEGAPDKAIAGQRQSALHAALASFRRALELNANAGVKKSIEAVERELNKEPAPAVTAPPATAVKDKTDVG